MDPLGRDWWPQGGQGQCQKTEDARYEASEMRPRLGGAGEASTLEKEKRDQANH